MSSSSLMTIREEFPRPRHLGAMVGVMPNSSGYMPAAPSSLNSNIMPNRKPAPSPLMYTGNISTAHSPPSYTWNKEAQAYTVTNLNSGSSSPMIHNNFALGSMPASPMRAEAQLGTPTWSRSPPLARSQMSPPNHRSPQSPMAYRAHMGAATLPHTPGGYSGSPMPSPAGLVGSSRLSWNVVEANQVTYGQKGGVKLIGLHQAPIVGLKVLLSEQGQQSLANSDLGPILTKGKPGFISRVGGEGDACMVIWETCCKGGAWLTGRELGGESGFYRCGAYGQYHLQMTESGNSEDEIRQRADNLKNSDFVFELGFN